MFLISLGRVDHAVLDGASNAVVDAVSDDVADADFLFCVRCSNCLHRPGLFDCF